MIDTFTFFRDQEEFKLFVPYTPIAELNHEMRRILSFHHTASEVMKSIPSRIVPEESYMENTYINSNNSHVSCFCCCSRRESVSKRSESNILCMPKQDGSIRLKSKFAILAHEFSDSEEAYEEEKKQKEEDEISLKSIPNSSEDSKRKQLKKRLTKTEIKTKNKKSLVNQISKGVNSEYSLNEVCIYLFVLVSFLHLLLESCYF